MGYFSQSNQQTPLAKLHCLGDVLFDEDDGDSQSFPDGTEHQVHFLYGLWRQPCARLVENDEAGMGGEGHGE